MLKDVTEAVECTKEFAHPEHNDLICKVLIIEKLLEAKASAVDGQIELLAKLFSALLKASPPVMSAAEIQAGFLRSCNAVPDASLDAPSCPTLVAKLFVQLVVLECVQLDMLQAILVEPVRTRPARLPADCSLLWLLPGRVRCPSDCPVRSATLPVAVGCSSFVCSVRLCLLQDLVEFGTAAKMVTTALTALRDTEVRAPPTKRPRGAHETH